MTPSRPQLRGASVSAPMHLGGDRIGRSRRDDGAAGARVHRGALAINDAGRAADAAYDLALSEVALDNHDDADQPLRQARYDGERASVDIADILQCGRRSLFCVPARRSRPHSQTTRLAPTPFPRSIFTATTLRGQIACDASDAARARSALESARKQAASFDGGLAPAAAADPLKPEGTIARLQGRADTAAHAFDAEAELLRAACHYRNMGDAIGRAPAERGRSRKASPSRAPWA